MALLLGLFCEEFTCSVSWCLCEFSADSPASSHSAKHACEAHWILKLSVAVKASERLFVSIWPCDELLTLQGVTLSSPNNILDRIQRL